MKPTSLHELLARGAQAGPSGLRVPVDQHFVVPGESQLSYTTLIRLAECERERFFEKEVPLLAQYNQDTIGRALSCEFHAPCKVPGVVELRTTVVKVGSRSFQLRIDLAPISQAIAATVTITLVFYDPQHGKAVAIPADVRAILLSRLAPSQPA